MSKLATSRSVCVRGRIGCGPKAGRLSQSQERENEHEVSPRLNSAGADSARAPPRRGRESYHSPKAARALNRAAARAMGSPATAGPPGSSEPAGPS